MKNIKFETWVIDSHDRLKKDHLGLEPDAEVLLSGELYSKSVPHTKKESIR